MVTRIAAPTRDCGVRTFTGWPKGPGSHYTPTSLSGAVFSFLSQNQEVLTANFVNTHTAFDPPKINLRGKNRTGVQAGLNFTWLICRQTSLGPR